MRRDDAQRALRAIYEATLRPDMWPEALWQLTETCNATVAAGQMVGRNSYHLVSSRGSEGFVQEFFEDGWHERNTRMQRGLDLTQSGLQGIVTEWNSFTPEELARDPYQQEFAPRHDIEAAAGMMVASHADAHFILTVERGRRPGPFEGRELDMMNRLFTNFPMLSPSRCASSWRRRATSWKPWARAARRSRCSRRAGASSA